MPKWGRGYERENPKTNYSFEKDPSKSLDPLLGVADQLTRRLDVREAL